MPNHKHKFIHKSTDAFFYKNGRYTKKFVMTDFFYCESCLELKEVGRQVVLPDHDVPDLLPEWAKGISQEKNSTY